MTQKRNVKHAVATKMKNDSMSQRAVGKPIKFDGPNAEVRVDIGATLNMGNYESLRLGISLSLPCAPTGPEIEKAFGKAVKWTEAKLDKMIEANKRPGSSKGDNDAELLG